MLGVCKCNDPFPLFRDNLENLAKIPNLTDAVLLKILEVFHAYSLQITTLNIIFIVYPCLEINWKI